MFHEDVDTGRINHTLHQPYIEIVKVAAGHSK